MKLALNRMLGVKLSLELELSISTCVFLLFRIYGVVLKVSIFVGDEFAVSVERLFTLVRVTKPLNISCFGLF